MWSQFSPGRALLLAPGAVGPPGPRGYPAHTGGLRGWGDADGHGVVDAERGPPVLGRTVCASGRCGPQQGNHALLRLVRLTVESLIQVATFLRELMKNALNYGIKP